MPTLILVSMLVFALQKLLPGDPVLVMAGEERDPQVLAYLREQVPARTIRSRCSIFAWLGQVVQGDFGISLRTDVPVPS